MSIKEIGKGKFIKFPDGYETEEYQRELVLRQGYRSKEERYANTFILFRGICERLGDDAVWKPTGDWRFSPSKSFKNEIKRIFDRKEYSMTGSLRIASPLFCDLWDTDDKGNSWQINYHETITCVGRKFLNGIEILVNPFDIKWTDTMMQLCDEYFREFMQLLNILSGASRGRKTDEVRENKYKDFEEGFDKSLFADYIDLPDNWREYGWKLRLIAEEFETLDSAKVQQVIEEKQASDLIQKIRNEEDITHILDRFEYQLSKNQYKQSFIKSNLIEWQKQIEITPPDKSRIVVERFNRDERLSEIIKRYYGWRCQICGFTFKKKNGGLYAEVHHLIPLSKGGCDSVENIIVVCPNHHAMFTHADVQILDVTSKKVDVLINGEQYVIERTSLQSEAQGT